MSKTPMIPGLTLVKKPLETYIIVREEDGDRELTRAEWDRAFSLLNGDREQFVLDGLNALKARFPQELAFANAGFTIDVVRCLVNAMWPKAPQ